jgi:hypothetical protein
MMKTATEWKRLTQTERRVWNVWAKDNPVLLDDGNERRVSGRKAMTMVLRNRATAGEGADAATVPPSTAWLSNALSTHDVGPFTGGPGYMGFYVPQNLVNPTRWFVWATRPLDDWPKDVHREFRFVTVLSLDPITAGEGTPDIAPAYRARIGSYNGPGEEGAWPNASMFVWFRLHQYAGGQLGPGMTLMGMIQVEL